MCSSSVPINSDKRRRRGLHSAAAPSQKRNEEFDNLVDQLLHEAVQNNIGGLEGLKAARGVLVNLFGRIEQLYEKIDEAFCGRPFLLHLPPDCPANRRRFNAYVNEYRKVSRLLFRATELWSFACGLKREDDWTPVLVADINRRILEQTWHVHANQKVPSVSN